MRRHSFLQLQTITKFTASPDQVGVKKGKPGYVGSHWKSRSDSPSLGLLPTCSVALFIMFRTHPVIAEGPANKLAHCASDFVAGSMTLVHMRERLNSTMLLFDLGQPLGAASLIFFSFSNKKRILCSRDTSLEFFSVGLYIFF